MKNYYPILVGKEGEYSALRRLTQKVKDRICPVIEILDNTKRKLNEQTGKKEKVWPPHFNGKDANFFRVHWRSHESAVILDFSKYERSEEYFELIREFIDTIISYNIKTTISIKHDSCEKHYELVKDYFNDDRCNVCIRLDVNGGLGNDVAKVVSSIKRKIGIEGKEEQGRVVYLLDMGMVKEDNIETLIEEAGLTLDILGSESKAIVTSSALPIDLRDYDEGEHKIERLEWTLWNTLLKNYSKLKYGDYGTKSSLFSDATATPAPSCKYTTLENYIIYRGRKKHPEGNDQYISHAKNLVKNPAYAGYEFSAGDKSIFQISRQSLKDLKKSPGNAGMWIEISQNHHITLLTKLVCDAKTP
jgi:hypothetical protein